MGAQEKPLSRDYASAAEAMQLLGVRRQTLYAYVSRGWIRSVSQKGVKDKLYLRDDLTRVGMRSLARSGHGPVAASAMNWGEPIFATSITEITPQGPRYRGHLAADLVRAGASCESVAELLWGKAAGVEPLRWPVPRPVPEIVGLARTMGTLQAGDSLLESFALVILMLGLRRGSVAGRLAHGTILPAAREIIHTVVACFGFVGPRRGYCPMLQGQSVIEGLMRALSVASGEENSAALQAILILLADHELSPGTLGARVVASAGGTLHSCLASALCATSGVDVGRAYEHIEEFLGTAATPGTLVRRARRLLASGLAVPGFEHPLYPKGDPRAAQLLQIARSRRQQPPQLRAALSFVDLMQQESGIFARQELAVVVLTRAMGLPLQVPAALFALARIPGLVAHVQEQRAFGGLLRPRARYVKPA